MKTLMSSWLSFFAIQKRRSLWMTVVMAILVLSAITTQATSYLTETTRTQYVLAQAIEHTHSSVSQAALYVQVYVLAPGPNVRGILRLSILETADRLDSETSKYANSSAIADRWQSLSELYDDVSGRLTDYAAQLRLFTSLPEEALTAFSPEYRGLLDESGRLQRDLDAMWLEGGERLDVTVNLLRLTNLARLGMVIGLVAFVAFSGLLSPVRTLNTAQAQAEYWAQQQTILREREAFLQEVLITTPGMIFVYDLVHNRNLFVSRGVDWLLTEEKYQAISTLDGFSTLLEMIDPEDLPELMNFRDAIEVGKLPYYSFVGRLKGIDGRVRWVQIMALPFKRDADGKITEIVGIGQNVTAQKIIEESLREQTHFVEQITATVPDTIYIFDLVKQCSIYANREIWNLLGYSPDELAALGNDFFPKLIHPEDLPRVLEGQRRFDVARDGQIIENELRMRHRNGQWRNLHTRDTIFRRDSNGKATEIIGVAQDITERKKSLEQAIALGIEREKVQILSSFITSASHEFRTPLTIINSDVYLLEHTEDLEKRYSRLRRIASQTEYLGRLVDQLVEMTILDSHSEITQVDTRLDMLIGNSLEPFEQAAAARDVSLKLRLDPTANLLACDPKLLVRVLHNLLDNALRYAPASSVITLTTGLVDDALFLSVCDSGVGIPPNQTLRVFERFFKGNDARTQDGSGAGLGLSIVKRIVDLHKGRIEIRSSPGQGTTITLFFPLPTSAAMSQTMRVVQG